jgi:hypothetical protein
MDITGCHLLHAASPIIGYLASDAVSDPGDRCVIGLGAPRAPSPPLSASLTIVHRQFVRSEEPEAIANNPMSQVIKISDQVEYTRQTNVTATNCAPPLFSLGTLGSRLARGNNRLHDHGNNLKAQMRAPCKSSPVRPALPPSNLVTGNRGYSLLEANEQHSFQASRAVATRFLRWEHGCTRLRDQEALPISQELLMACRSTPV